MEQDCYRVEVLHHINPHLIWVEVVNTRGDIIFEQVGVYGVLPLVPSIAPNGDITFEKADKWAPAATALIKKFFTRSEEMWFYPIHIDRRTSIFDSNIHKFGDIVGKKSTGEERLSHLLTQSGFAIHNIPKFHHKLSSGGITTKLSHTQTVSVMQHIEAHYENSNTNWKTCLQKQTYVYNTSLELKALTMKNLERHNNYLESMNLFDNKLEDLSMCKDFDEPSIGRASRKNKETSKCSSLSNENLLKFNRNRKKPSNNDTTDVLLAAKSFLDKHAPKLERAETNTADTNKDDFSSDSDKEKIMQYSNREPINIECGSNESVNRNFSLDDDIQSAECEILHDSKNNSVNNDYNVSKKNKGHNGNHNFAVNLHQVAYGPPEINPSKLHVRLMSTIARNQDHAPKNKNDKKPDENMLPEDSKSEVINSNMSAPHELISIHRTNTTPIKKEKIHGNSIHIENFLPVKLKNKSSSLQLQRKLKQFKEITSVNRDSSITSDSDSTNKESSSLGEFKASNNKGFPDSDSDNISDIVREINLHVVKKKVDEPKEVDITCDKIDVNPFKNLDGSHSVFVDKLVSPILLVHTKNNNKIKPYSHFRDVPFGSDIQGVLGRMSIKEPTRIQSVTWHSILRGHSVFMIGSLGSGKTIGYLPAVCRIVSDSHKNKETTGPSCIIVCGTAQSVSEIERLSKLLLGLEEKVVACYVGLDEIDFTTTLLNGCDLLICVPSLLARLLLNLDYGVDLRSLKTFVIDDYERISDVYPKELKFAIHNIKNMLKNRANKEVKVQFVAASRIWSDSLSSLVKTASDSVVCIGAFQECILYSKSNTTVNLVKNDNKVNEVLSFMRDINGSKKTVIVCSSDNEVKHLEAILTKNKHIVFACNNSMTVHDLYSINISWGDYKEPTIGPILVCCDENLSHMNVTDAHYLVHYSLPALFSTFCKRFSVLNDNYPSIFKENCEIVKIKILLEEKNMEQLPKILHFIKRCTANVPEVLDDISKEVLIQKDLLKAKKYVPLCDTYLALGNCPNFWYCQERHTIFKEYDTPKEWMPKEGELRFNILHYHTAVSYSARLLSNSINGEIKRYPQSYSTLSLKMGMYYSKESNRVPHGVPVVGDLCALALRQHLFVRCQVVKIINRYPNGKPNYVLIKLIDEERFERSRDIYLFHLPDDLRKIETYVVQIRLANVKPLDKDITFADFIKNHFRKLTDDNEELFMRGTVVLTVGNCVFVDSLEACQDLCSLNETVVRHNFKKELLEMHAVVNEDHIATLESNCKKCDLIMESTSAYEKSIEKSEDSTITPIKGDWAHLDINDLSPVYLAYAENPGKFFVRHAKFEPCMNTLLKDIQKYVADNPEPIDTVRKGDIVLAKFPEDNNYERARIDRIIDKNTVECFFVDHGDWFVTSTNDLRPITDKFIQQMPYQAIECRLVGIKPAGSDWTDYGNNWFCDNCFEDGSRNMKLLYVKCYTKEVAEYTEGHKYGVAIIDTSSDKDVVINKTLIELNLAQVNLNEINYFSEMISTYNNVNTAKLETEHQSSDITAPCKNINNEIQVRKLDTAKSKFDFDIDDDPPEQDFELNVDEAMAGLFKSNVPNWLAKEVKTKYPVIVTSEGKVIKNEFNDVSISSRSTNGVLAIAGSSKCNYNEPRIETVSDLFEEDLKTTSIKIKELSDSDEVETNKTVADAFQKDKLRSKHCDTSIEQTNEDESNNYLVKNYNVDSTQNLDDSTTNTSQTLDDTSANSTQNSDKTDKLRKPKLCWRQTKMSVSIKIMLIGVEAYDLEIKEKSIRFFTEHNDTKYGFEFELYGVVNKNTVTHSNKGQYILIKMIKLMQKNWLTLTRDCAVKKWLAYDVDSIDTSSDEEAVSHNTIADVVKNMHKEESESEDDEFKDDINFSYS